MDGVFPRKKPGFILSSDQLIEVMTKYPKHSIWNYDFTTSTEELYGLDRFGMFYQKNTPVVLVFHGGALITPEKIGDLNPANPLISGSDDGLQGLLDGRLPDGIRTSVHSYNHIMNGVVVTNRRYGIVMPYEVARSTRSGVQSRDELLKNPLAVARAGGRVQFKQFLSKIPGNDPPVNYQNYKELDPTKSSGCLIKVCNDAFVFTTSPTDNPQKFAVYTGPAAR